jgi:hypothetical protein
MTTQLHQRKGRDYRKFRITPEALLVERKSIGSYDGYKLTWEEVDFDAVVRGRGFDTRKMITLISFILNVVLAFWVVWLLWEGIRGTWWFIIAAVLAAGAFVVPVLRLAKQERNLVLYGDTNVTFYYRSSDEEAVDAFIKCMKLARNKYLRERFLKLDELLPLEDQVKMVQQLYVNKMISREDLASVMEEVKMRRLFEE